MVILKRPLPSLTGVPGPQPSPTDLCLPFSSYSLDQEDQTEGVRRKLEPPTVWRTKGQTVYKAEFDRVTNSWFWSAVAKCSCPKTSCSRGGRGQGGQGKPGKGQWGKPRGQESTDWNGDDVLTELGNDYGMGSEWGDYGNDDYEGKPGRGQGGRPKGKPEKGKRPDKLMGQPEKEQGGRVKEERFESPSSRPSSSGSRSSRPRDSGPRSTGPRA